MCREYWLASFDCTCSIVSCMMHTDWFMQTEPFCIRVSTRLFRIVCSQKMVSFLRVAHLIEVSVIYFMLSGRQGYLSMSGWFWRVDRYRWNWSRLVVLCLSHLVAPTRVLPVLCDQKLPPWVSWLDILRSKFLALPDDLLLFIGLCYSLLLLPALLWHRPNVWYRT